MGLELVVGMVDLQEEHWCFGTVANGKGAIKCQDLNRDVFCTGGIQIHCVNRERTPKDFAHHQNRILDQCTSLPHFHNILTYRAQTPKCSLCLNS